MGLNEQNTHLRVQSLSICHSLFLIMESIFLPIYQYHQYDENPPRAYKFLRFSNANWLLSLIFMTLHTVLHLAINSGETRNVNRRMYKFLHDFIKVNNKLNKLSLTTCMGLHNSHYSIHFSGKKLWHGIQLTYFPP